MIGYPRPVRGFGAWRRRFLPVVGGKVVLSSFFAGETSLGEFRVPHEIVAPADPGLGAATVLVEPPHWFHSPLGRDLIVGQEVIFSKGIRYASVPPTF